MQNIIYTILSFPLLMVLIRIIFFRTQSYFIEESSSKIFYLEKPWYLMYSCYKIDPSENYNWIKINADIKKGVDEVLAVQREFVIALEIEMDNLNNNYKNLLVSKQNGKVLLYDYERFLAEHIFLLEHLEAEHSLKVNLQSLGEDTFKELLEALKHPENFDKED